MGICFIQKQARLEKYDNDMACDSTYKKNIYIFKYDILLNHMFILFSLPTNADLWSLMTHHNVQLLLSLIHVSPNNT